MTTPLQTVCTHLDACLAKSTTTEQDRMTLRKVRPESLKRVLMFERVAPNSWGYSGPMSRNNHFETSSSFRHSEKASLHRDQKRLEAPSLSLPSAWRRFSTSVPKPWAPKTLEKTKERGDYTGIYGQLQSVTTMAPDSCSPSIPYVPDSGTRPSSLDLSVEDCGESTNG